MKPSHVIQLSVVLQLTALVVEQRYPKRTTQAWGLCCHAVDDAAFIDGYQALRVGAVWEALLATALACGVMNVVS